MKAKFLNPKREYDTFLVYGGFTEPDKGVNFVVIRMVKTRGDKLPRALQSAINKLVHPWFSEADREHDKNRHRYCDDRVRCGWLLDGDSDGNLWETKKALRYEWTGKELILQ